MCEPKFRKNSVVVVCISFSLKQLHAFNSLLVIPSIALSHIQRLYDSRVSLIRRVDVLPNNILMDEADLSTGLTNEHEGRDEFGYRAVFIEDRYTALKHYVHVFEVLVVTDRQRPGRNPHLSNAQTRSKMVNDGALDLREIEHCRLYHINIQTLNYVHTTVPAPFTHTTGPTLFTYIG